MAAKVDALMAEVELRNTVVAMCAFVERYATDFRSRSRSRSQGGAAAV